MRDLLCALCGNPRSKHMGRLEVCPIEARFRVRRSDRCGAGIGRRGGCPNMATHECTAHAIRRGTTHEVILRRCEEHLTGERRKVIT